MQEVSDKLLFLDTETTGREQEDRIFQLAFVYKDKKYNALCKPPVPISIEAMEATHYTNKDVADKPTFASLQEAKILKEILQTKDVYIVAHNAPFDIAMLEKEGIKVEKYIDTLKVARHLDPEEKLGAYRLQYLRYALELDVGKLPAHDALADVEVLIALFKRLFARLKRDGLDSLEALKRMHELTNTPVEIKTINFGKYKGEKIKDLAKKDPDYLRWLYTEKKKELSSGQARDDTHDWIYTLEKYLKQTQENMIK